MLDKKLTDSEIVNIVEYCSTFGDCDFCKIVLPSGVKKGTIGCFSCLLKLTLSVISNQKTETEQTRYRLADTIVRCAAIEEKIKAEAVKEFAERLKEKSKQGKGYLGNVYHSVDVAEIDNLLKELAGDNQ